MQGLNGCLDLEHEVDCDFLYFVHRTEKILEVLSTLYNRKALSSRHEAAWRKFFVQRSVEWSYPATTAQIYGS